MLLKVLPRVPEPRAVMCSHLALQFWNPKPHQQYDPDFGKVLVKRDICSMRCVHRLAPHLLKSPALTLAKKISLLACL
jgi:hypothetical protein